MRDTIREAGMSEAYSSYLTASVKGWPLLKILVENGCLKDEECVWMPIFDTILQYAPCFFDETMLREIEPFYRQAVTFLKSDHSDAETDWDYDDIDQRIGVGRKVREFFHLLPKSPDTIIQSAFVKEHQDEYSELPLSQLFYWWEHSGHVSRVKHGRSYKVAIKYDPENSSEEEFIAWLDGDDSSPSTTTSPSEPGVTKNTKKEEPLIKSKEDLLHFVVGFTAICAIIAGCWWLVKRFFF